MKFYSKLHNYNEYKDKFFDYFVKKFYIVLNQEGLLNDKTSSFYREYNLILQQKSLEIINMYHKVTGKLECKLLLNECEQLIKEFIFIKRISNTKTWPNSWCDLIKQYYSRYDLTPNIEFEAYTKTKSKDVSIESFTEYAIRVENILRKELCAYHRPDYNPILSPEVCFKTLNYVQGDSPYNYKESFFLEKDKVLTSHLTPYFVLSKLNNQFENSLGYNKCYRRENPDKTHLCEFNQLELHINSITQDPSKELKNLFLQVLIILGLDPKYIEFRTTHYPYVSPAYQIFYTKDGFIEVGGCGIMLNSVISNPSFYLAGAVGLERCYTLLYKLDTISQVHPYIHK